METDRREQDKDKDNRTRQQTSWDLVGVFAVGTRGGTAWQNKQTKHEEKAFNSQKDYHRYGIMPVKKHLVVYDKHEGQRREEGENRQEESSDCHSLPLTAARLPATWLSSCPHLSKPTPTYPSLPSQQTNSTYSCTCFFLKHAFHLSMSLYLVFASFVNKAWQHIAPPPHIALHTCKMLTAVPGFLNMHTRAITLPSPARTSTPPASLTLSLSLSISLTPL